ncbi:MAG TPA: cytochrome o ubiquinol oxidase subunit III [Candidatus Saccharimonadales bacterium]|nr:cytochrome o ubiquinol oxidase subunit III [Candidatus Saccharimonadales bacterium]
MNQVSTVRLNERDKADNKTYFGFWLYLMTDCVLFASLFAVYAVLHKNSFGGPGARQLFDLSYALKETLILLTSSFTCGLAVLAAQARNKKLVMYWFGATFILGVSFLVLELNEFSRLVSQGDAWHRSGFLSSYFTLVGTHGLHITIGLLWMAVMIFRLRKTSLTRDNIRKLTLLSLFWHFLDVVWIFIFTVVYLFGGLGI